MFARMAAVCLLLLAAAGTGCGMCQSCTDFFGPTIESSNHPDYHHSPRSGSASVGMPHGVPPGVPHGMPVEGEVIQQGPMYPAGTPGTIIDGNGQAVEEPAEGGVYYERQGSGSR